MVVPADIVERIEQLFYAKEEQEEVLKLIEGLWATTLNVGPAQLARSILVIAGNDKSKIVDIVQSKFYGDPRDVILQAEYLLGNPGHYFITPFKNDDRLNSNC